MIKANETRLGRRWTVTRDGEHIGTIWTAGDGDSFHWVTRAGSGREETLSKAMSAIDDATTCKQAKRSRA